METLDYGFDPDGLGIIASVAHQTDRGPAWPLLDQTFTWDAMEMMVRSEQNDPSAPGGFENHTFTSIYDGLGMLRPRLIW